MGKIPQENLVGTWYETGLQELREKYVECTDHGDDEHFVCLHEFGSCPYCGVTEADAVRGSDES